MRTSLEIGRLGCWGAEAEGKRLKVHGIRFKEKLFKRMIELAVKLIS
jgi:hypothetical protein